MIWKYLPANLAHSLAPLGLAYYASRMPESAPEWQSFDWRNMHFPNRLGIAGGLDKNADYLTTWSRLGVGFIEVGTVTPYSQSPNRGKILDRDWDGKNLWNKMGFPSHGADEVYFNLRAFLEDSQKQMTPQPLKKKWRVPLFVNIGKNRNRPNDEAEVDYLYLTDRFAPVADVFVINVSSPNTTGLRDLQSEETLKNLTGKVVKLAGEKPVLVKLSPDLSENNLKASLDACLESQVSGFILTNTTLSRPADCQFPLEGGLSGKSLAELSKKSLKMALAHLGSARKDLLLVSVGGVLTADDVKERLQLGADLVQVYSALIFNGPRFFRDTAVRMST